MYVGTGTSDGEGFRLLCLYMDTAGVRYSLHISTYIYAHVYVYASVLICSRRFTEKCQEFSQRNVFNRSDRPASAEVLC